MRYAGSSGWLGDTQRAAGNRDLSNNAGSSGAGTGVYARHGRETGCKQFARPDGEVCTGSAEGTGEEKKSVSEVEEVSFELRGKICRERHKATTGERAGEHMILVITRGKGHSRPMKTNMKAVIVISSCSSGPVRVSYRHSVGGTGCLLSLTRSSVVARDSLQPAQRKIYIQDSVAVKAVKP